MVSATLFAWSNPNPTKAEKTMIILTTLSLFGCSGSAYYVKGTNVFFLERSASSTLLHGTDDPQTGRAGAKANRSDLPELIVNLYNAAKSANAVQGSKKPKSVPVVATNLNKRDDDR